MKKTTIILLFTLYFILLYACSPDGSSIDGQSLARVHCASCHAYPGPQLLDRKSWDQHILPRMGYMMGVLPLDSVGADFIEPTAREAAYRNPNLFRKEAVLSREEWASIRQYYMDHAPEKLSGPELPAIQNGLSIFSTRFPDHYLSPPGTTFLGISGGQLYLGDAHTHRLFGFNAELEVEKTASVGGVPVWLNQNKEGWLVTDMGAFAPTDVPLGRVLFFPASEEGNARILTDSLKRPVHTEMADLDGDDRLDLVICEFGKWTGSLCWWKNDGRGNFERKLLRNMPGAIKAYTRDLNADGYTDIIALFGQGDEGVFIYYNDGKGHFTEERVLRFPPSYGSSYFNLFDYNGDEYPDLIYTCGDNADFIPVQKPYHGIRIFQNSGNNQFEEVFFYPMHGAYAAIAEDYDQDGDMDIAAISFFPDFQDRPEAGFLYLENKGRREVLAHTFPEVTKGRWIVMDAGDLDEDGDIDLVLGSLAFEVIPKMGLVEQWVKDGIPFLVLENKLID